MYFYYTNKYFYFYYVYLKILITNKIKGNILI